MWSMELGHALTVKLSIADSSDTATFAPLPPIFSLYLAALCLTCTEYSVEYEKEVHICVGTTPYYE